MIKHAFSLSFIRLHQSVYFFALSFSKNASMCHNVYALSSTQVFSKPILIQKSLYWLHMMMIMMHSENKDGNLIFFLANKFCFFSF